MVINNECYVSLEVAKQLKAANFDRQVNHSYPNYNALNNGNYGGLYAPILALALRW